MFAMWIWVACSGQETVEIEEVQVEPDQETVKPTKQTVSNGAKGPGGPPQKNGALSGPQGKNIGPSGNGPQGPPPNRKGGQVANGSGGAFQDPSGFPPFHDWKAQRPPIEEVGGGVNHFS